MSKGRELQNYHSIDIAAEPDNYQDGRFLNLPDDAWNIVFFNLRLLPYFNDLFDIAMTCQFFNEKVKNKTIGGKLRDSLNVIHPSRFSLFLDTTPGKVCATLFYYFNVTLSGAAIGNGAVYAAKLFEDPSKNSTDYSNSESTLQPQANTLTDPQIRAAIGTVGGGVVGFGVGLFLQYKGDAVNKWILNPNKKSIQKIEKLRKHIKKDLEKDLSQEESSITDKDIRTANKFGLKL